MSNIPQITDIQSVFPVFGKLADMARVLEVGPSTVSEMRRRNSIPVEYWPRLVEEAERIGRNDLTLEKLVEVTAEQARKQKLSRQGHAA